ncbi:MAG: AlpA family transcriptional regulator [Methylococcales bacterium]|nr:AlpA family transcriptional regulator [Methylococcales bacterium]
MQSKINTIIRLPQAIQKTGLSRSTIYALEGRGEFPQKIKLSTRSMGFLEKEVDDWIAAKAASRNEA